MYKGVNVTFQNLKTLEGREGLIIQADIKYNGKKIGTYRDDGHGGCVDIEAIGSLTNTQDKYEKSKAYVENSNLLQKMNAEFAALPKVKFEGVELDDCIEFAMDEFILERELVKDAKKGLLVSIKDSHDDEYSLVKWKAGSIPKMIKSYGSGKIIPMIEKEIKKAQAEGDTVLCQNYYISIGVNPSIFD